MIHANLTCYLYQVRVDSGIEEGSDISIYYDPMISKVSDGPPCNYVFTEGNLLERSVDSAVTPPICFCSWSPLDQVEQKLSPEWRRLWITM